MYKRILIPLGLNDVSEKLITAVKGVVGGADSAVEVCLVHVVETINGYKEADADAEEAAFYNDIKTKAEEFLSKTTEEFQQQGISCTAQVLLGEQAGEVMKAAKDNEVDLVVMQSHRVENDEEKLGSFSQKVGVFAPCSVLLVR